MVSSTLMPEGVAPRFWRVRNPGARLLLEDLRALLSSGRVRVVALPYASNATGRIVDVVGAARLARAAGALTFVDAVHFSPEGMDAVARLLAASIESTIGDGAAR